jgi:hypothetical protein
MGETPTKMRPNRRRASGRIVSKFPQSLSESGTNAWRAVIAAASRYEPRAVVAEPVLIFIGGPQPPLLE